MNRIFIGYLSVCICIMSCVQHVNCNKASIENSGKVYDVKLVEKRLQVYDVIPCLKLLFKDIAEANSKYYDSLNSFYSISYAMTFDKSFMVIKMDNFQAIIVNDYTGAISIDNYTFLCRGKIDTSDLFLQIDRKLDFKFKLSPDTSYNGLGMEPKLRGLFEDCNRHPVVLEVYVPVSIPDYDMSVRPDK